ncbi:hypothetical protein MN116_001110 [Schistosoma mekongi]|uniref:Uncharacterized protein n=1 Tax=Schistosoma mekongi TaxID=38744 RepID=A0AAE1ZKK6_SCHME|nr:hypothetical protein MN116_001110 [Schistosoma mekongi]
MMANLDISELGISKNLLRMNFMRRTLVAKEKAANQSVPDILLNSQEYAFKLPSSVEEIINKRANVLKSRYRYHFINSIFKLYNVSPGLRESFGGFNPPPTSNTTSQSQVTNPSNPSLSICENSVYKCSKSSKVRASRTSIRFRRFEGNSCKYFVSVMLFFLY